jgi:CRP-like cAMP-binding protein
MSARALFLNTPNRREVGAGEVIYAEGETGTYMYGIIDGSVELSKGAVTVASLGPDDIFGERALVDNHPRDLTAVATSPTTLAELDRYLFLFLVDQSPKFALDIMGALAGRLRSYDNWIASLADAGAAS